MLTRGRPDTILSSTGRIFYLTLLTIMITAGYFTIILQIKKLGQDRVI